MKTQDSPVKLINLKKLFKEILNVKVCVLYWGGLEVCIFGSQAILIQIQT